MAVARAGLVPIEMQQWMFVVEVSGRAVLFGSQSIGTIYHVKG